MACGTEHRTSATICLVEDGFLTPEDAALNGFSTGAAARVRASAINEDVGRAVVLVDTDPTHPIEVICVLDGDRWHEAGSGNGWTWAPLDDEGTIGFQTAWDEVPSGVRAVRVEFAGRVGEAPVTNGLFLFVDWAASETDARAWPHVVGYLTDDDGWETQAVDRGQLRAERILRSGPPIGWRRLLPRWWRTKIIGIRGPE
jgi:hypothetical protein